MQHDLVLRGQFAEPLTGDAVDLQHTASRLDGDDALLVQHIAQPFLLR